MAHIISNESGRSEMFYAGTAPWHRLGTRVDQAVSGAEAIQLAGLDWDVVQRPIYMAGDAIVGTDDARPMTKITDRVANVRSDTGTYLGTVGHGYVPIQNRVLFDFADALLQAGAKFETAGALNKGKRVWALARLDGDVEVGDGDAVERYLCMANGHDGTMAGRIFATGIRVVCNNTLRAAMSQSARMVSLRHTSNVMDRVDDARKTLGLVAKRFDGMADTWRMLRRAKAGDGAVERYFADLFPIDDTNDRTRKRTTAVVRDLMANFHEGRGADVAGRSWWGAYNAVTEYLSHQKKYTGKTDAARSENRFRQLVMDGNASSIDARALSMAEAAAN